MELFLNMMLKNYYYSFKSAIPLRICDDIIKYGTQQKSSLALTGGLQNKINPLTKKLSQKDEKDLKKKRYSDVVWMTEKWVYKEIHPYIAKANQEAGWNFEYDWSESCQFTKYSKDQYYGWHCDSWEGTYGDPKDLNTYGKTRKLSVTVSLSDPLEYKGGELEFDFRNFDPDKKRNVRKCKEILPKGSIVVFPSFCWHRVCPVKSGTRYSLVVWNLGRPYK